MSKQFDIVPAGIYLLEVKNTEILEQGVTYVQSLSFEHISDFAIVFRLLALSSQMPAEMAIFSHRFGRAALLQSRTKYLRKT